MLPNCDLDSGNQTKAAEYSLTDETYAKLLAQLSERKFDWNSPELRDNILQFYSDLSVPIETKNYGSLASRANGSGPVKVRGAGSNGRGQLRALRRHEAVSGIWR